MASETARTKSRDVQILSKHDDHSRLVRRYLGRWSPFDVDGGEKALHAVDASDEHGNYRIARGIKDMADGIEDAL